MFAMVLAALLGASSAYAEVVEVKKLEVKDFRLDPKDRTACRKATAKKDTNGKKCAVIKVNDGAKASYQSAGAAEVTAQPNLIYVSAKEQSVVISDSTINSSVEYKFATPLKAGKTYVMDVEVVVENDTIPDIPEPAPVVVPEQQFVLFTVTPEQAIIELGTEVIKVRGGEAQELLNVGDYKYKVSAKGFYPEEGEFSITDSAKVEIAVNLREANGWIKIIDKDEEITGAAVYVDDEFVGNAPMVYGKLTSGEHKLLVAKEQYSNAIGTVTVTDNDTLIVCPCLRPNFSAVTVKTAPKAEIWANGEWKGTGTWTGKLLAGVYNFEAREQGYTSQVITEEVPLTPEGVEITIPDPQPIYGNLVIKSFPAKACVFVDGEKVGQTPVYLPQIQWGEHKVQIYKKGYKPYCETVMMSESMRIVLEPELVALPEGCCCDFCTCDDCCGQCTEKCEKCCGEAKPAECCEQKAAECCEEKPAECPEEAKECCEETKPECSEEATCPECPGEKPAEEPADTPADEPAETPSEAPVETPTDTPAE